MGEEGKGPLGVDNWCLGMLFNADVLQIKRNIVFAYGRLSGCYEWILCFWGQNAPIWVL